MARAWGAATERVVTAQGIAWRIVGHAHSPTRPRLQTVRRQFVSTPSSGVLRTSVRSFLSAFPWTWDWKAPHQAARDDTDTPGPFSGPRHVEGPLRDGCGVIRHVGSSRGRRVSGDGGTAVDIRRRFPGPIHHTAFRSRIDMRFAHIQLSGDDIVYQAFAIFAQQVDLATA